MVKKAKKQTVSHSKDEKMSLKEQLNSSIVEQLTKKKQLLQAEEDRKKEEQTKKLQEMRKQQEKNKTFEQLLNESELKWKEFK